MQGLADVTVGIQELFANDLPLKSFNTNSSTAMHAQSRNLKTTVRGNPRSHKQLRLFVTSRRS